MTEFGIITAKGAQNVGRLKGQLDRLPEAVRMPVNLLFDQLAETDQRIERLTAEIEETHKQSEISQRLATIPGVGMLSATIIAATTPDVGNFDCARDYAAWLGLTPKPHSTGGKQKMGAISKMGNRYIRRLLYLGAMAQIMLRYRLKREPGSDWLSSMLIRKKTKVVAIALAHRMRERSSPSSGTDHVTSPRRPPDRLSEWSGQSEVMANKRRRRTRTPRSIRSASSALD